MLIKVYFKYMQWSVHSWNSREAETQTQRQGEREYTQYIFFQSDMHNLGIILLELFQSFTTMSERIHAIDALKMQRVLDKEVLLHWPDIVRIVCWVRRFWRSPCCREFLLIEVFVLNLNYTGIGYAMTGVLFALSF